MEYLFTFLEGIASFISPCILPMLPVYISYFIGQDEKNNKKTAINAIAFVLGFTAVFMLFSILASTIGIAFKEYIRYMKILFGVIVIILGINYMDIIKIKFLNKTKQRKIDTTNLNFIKAFVFGIMFSISWTPCIGTFLSSALLLVAKQEHLAKGILLMLIYSIGLGIPFIISAILMEKFKKVFGFIKNNYNIIKKISGTVLITMGIYMIFF